MKVFLGIVAGIFALGTIAERKEKSGKTLAICFCITLVAIVAISIF